MVLGPYSKETRTLELSSNASTASYTFCVAIVARIGKPRGKNKGKSTAKPITRKIHLLSTVPALNIKSNNLSIIHLYKIFLNQEYIELM